MKDFCIWTSLISEYAKLTFSGRLRIMSGHVSSRCLLQTQFSITMQAVKFYVVMISRNSYVLRELRFFSCKAALYCLNLESLTLPPPLPVSGTMHHQNLVLIFFWICCQWEGLMLRKTTYWMETYYLFTRIVLQYPRYQYIFINFSLLFFFNDGFIGHILPPPPKRGKVKHFEVSFIYFVYVMVASVFLDDRGQGSNISVHFALEVST